MREFTTAKGTKLPIMNLKGKDYLTVQWRIVWMREEHPDWIIETEIKPFGQDACMAKASIRDHQSVLIAMAHKVESAQGFGDYVEKAETGAIGRALALCGYGTQFTDELNEQQRIVDAPVEFKPIPGSIADLVAQKPHLNHALAGDLDKFPPEERKETKPAPLKPKAEEPFKVPQSVKEKSGVSGAYVITFGKKFKNKTIEECDYDELKSFIEWTKRDSIQKGEKRTATSLELENNFNAYWNGSSPSSQAPLMPVPQLDNVPWPDENEVPF